MNRAIEAIVSEDPAVRNRTAEEILGGKTTPELLRLTEELERFRTGADSLYHRVRASLLIFAAYRFHILNDPALAPGGKIPPAAAARLRRGDHEGAIALLRPLILRRPSALLVSAQAEACYRRAFDYLLDQVKRAIGTDPRNRWMFEIASLNDYPLRIADAYRRRERRTGRHPVAFERSPVRIDPCHSGWSDIFFLAMDYPEGARVVNLSVDIAVRGKGPPVAPIECWCRLIDRPLIRLISLDLGGRREIRTFSELFDFGGDRLSLLKAGIIASGVIPPGLETGGVRLGDVLRRLAGPGRGIELVTRVRDLPRGSRLAVSTALLNAVIACLMRFTGQIASPSGPLDEKQRYLVVSRTILGEWLGGSGGGWQDSGGLWPGIKTITGQKSRPGDPEFGLSRGRLLPRYRVIPPGRLPPGIERALARGLILVHGGMAQNIGPVLEMVTEKYLLRHRAEWRARLRERGYYNGIVRALRRGNLRALGGMTTADWEGGTKVIIPQATNAYTEDLISRLRRKWKERYWGFLMLGGAAGGGMGFIVDPRVNRRFAADVLKTMRELKRRYGRALPFARKPEVFEFALNRVGIEGFLLPGRSDALRGDSRRRRSEGFPASRPKTLRGESYPIDRPRQAAARRSLRSGRIGLRQNRLPPRTTVRDALPSDLRTAPAPGSAEFLKLRELGRKAIREGRAAVVTLSGGVGSRWTEGAAVVKAINPFLLVQGRHRSFLEIHLAKSEKTSRDFGRPVQHAFTTSHLTYGPISEALRSSGKFGFGGSVYLSRSPFLLRRLVPTERDLRACFRERLEQAGGRHERAFLASRRANLIRWARGRKECEPLAAADPFSSFYPPGHWYEIPALLISGTLGRMLGDNPGLSYLLVHNLDTLGATLDPLPLGLHISSGRPFTFEVTPAHWGDRGGFLARVNGKARIVETLALPREADAARLSYYNSLTCWIAIDGLLGLFGLTRKDVSGRDSSRRTRVARAIGRAEKRMPTYVTLKEAQAAETGEAGTALAAQCEKLWGDITALPEVEAGYIVVDRKRGQQLKDPALLDHFLRDGSLDHLLERAVFSLSGRTCATSC